MAKQISLTEVRSLVECAGARADKEAELVFSENPQSRALGLRAEGCAEAFAHVLEALKGSTRLLRIDAGNMNGLESARAEED